MSENDTNIYRIARTKAGLTQEAAAEALGVSAESIKAYESYARLPPSHVVDGMCTVYNAIYLAYQHIRIAAGEIKVVPEVEVLSLERAAIRVINRALAFAESRGSLMQIAEDGVIDEAERPAFDAILSALDELIQAAIELKISRESRD